MPRSPSKACPTRCAAKAGSTTYLDGTSIIYLPPALCVVCADVNLTKLLLPRSINESELEEIERTSISWDLASIRRSSTRCPLCELLLLCLPGHEQLDSCQSYQIIARPQPIAGYRFFGEISILNTLGITRPSRKIYDEVVGWQLNVELKNHSVTETPIETAVEAGTEQSAASRRTSIDSLYRDPSPLASEHVPETNQEVPFVRLQKDHPTYNRFLTEYEDDPSYPTSVRALGHAEGVLRNFSRHRDTHPAGGETIAGLCIQLIARQPKGPLDCISTSYETENLMKCRGIRPAHADFPLARRWLDHCSRWHKPFCEPSSQTESTPAPFELRVIDLQKECIVNAPNNCRYAALSYCWGRAKQLELTQDNYPRLTQKGGLNEYASVIPNTIQDACIACKALRLRYLWVDALCIIQDSASDKANQIECMGYVYGGSYLTIVAGYGSDANAGLPGVRNIPRNRQHFRADVGGLQLSTAPVNAMTTLLNSAWYSRGWTFQELVLSKRLLAFTEDQMLFFCVKGSCREDVVLETHNGMLNAVQNLGNQLDRHISLTGRKFSAHYADQGLKSYGRFVEDFLHRSLSKDSDILNAFSGILEALFPHIGPFRWGIPVILATRVLAWYSKDQCFLRRRAGFPSWSWAGWQGYTESVQFHPSAFLFHDSYGFDVRGECFLFVFTEDGRYIQMSELYKVNFGKPGSLDALAVPCDEDMNWPSLSASYDQYLMVLTEMALLSVAEEPEAVSDEEGEHDKGTYTYLVWSGFTKIGSVCLNPAWRNKKSRDMLFVSIHSFGCGRLVMLVEMRGSIAYRVQMIDDFVVDMAWQAASPKTDHIILG